MEFKRDESKLHNAPVGILYLNMLISLIFIGLIIAIVIGIFNRHFELIYRCIGISVVVCLYSIFSEIYYNYYENVTIKFEKNKIMYTYNLNKDFIPTSNSNVSIQIKSITKIRRKLNKLRIYGDITKKSPMNKPKNQKYCDIVLNNFNIAPNELINKIKELKESK